MTLLKEVFLLIGALILWINAFFYHSDIPRHRILKKHRPDNLQTTIVQGDTIYYADSGSGETILLLHGTSSFLQTWDPWTRSLDKEYRIIRPDLPGFGLTGSLRDKDFSLEKYVAVLSGLMESLDIQSYHIAGNSFGAYLATQMALQNPQKVKSLCILSGSGYRMDSVQTKTSGFSLATIPGVRNVMRYITPKFIVGASIKSFYGNPKAVSDSAIQRYFDYLLCSSNREALILKSAQNYPALNDKLRDIRCKTLVIWGEEDTLIPLPKGRALARAIPHARLVTLPGIGHLPMEESPTASLNAYTDFLKHLHTTQ